MLPSLQFEGLLKAVDSLTRQAATYESVLVEHGLPADFVAQLHAAMTTLTASVDGRRAARAGVVGATKEVTTSVSLSHQYVKTMDAAISKALRTRSAGTTPGKSCGKAGGDALSSSRRTSSDA
jgi:hypothetical protein